MTEKKMLATIAAVVSFPGEVNAARPRAISSKPRIKLPQSLFRPRMEPAGNPPKTWSNPKTNIKEPASVVSEDRSNWLIRNGQLSANTPPNIVSTPKANIKDFSFRSSLAFIRYVTPIISQNMPRNWVKRWMLPWPLINNSRARSSALSPRIKFTDQCLIIFI